MYLYSLYHPRVRYVQTCLLMSWDSRLLEARCTWCVTGFRAVNKSSPCLSPRTSPSLPTSRPARARDKGDAVWCCFLLDLILIKGRKGSKCCFKFSIMYLVCHLCWFSWRFEVSLALVLCLRQNCLLLHCSCCFTCFYVHFYFIVLLCRCGYNCMKLCFWFYPVTFSYRSHPLPCRNTPVWIKGIGLTLLLLSFPLIKNIFLILFLNML